MICGSRGRARRLIDDFLLRQQPVLFRCRRVRVKRAQVGDPLPVEAGFPSVVSARLASGASVPVIAENYPVSLAEEGEAVLRHSPEERARAISLFAVKVVEGGQPFDRFSDPDLVGPRKQPLWIVHAKHHRLVDIMGRRYPHVQSIGRLIDGIERIR